MKIQCPHCHKTYNVPDERFPEKDEIAFPCPACKKVIELDLRPVRGESSKGQEQREDQVSTSSDETLKGEALKKRILRTVRDLPPMPQTVIRAQEIMRNPKSSFEDLAKVLETDQAVAARVLKLANSPFYGMMGKISSLQHASVVLGQRTLEELITIAGTSGLLGGKLEGYRLDAGDLWQHSMGVAFGSKLIAGKKHPALENDAFAAGLIHDVGKLALDSYIKERNEVFETVINEGAENFTTAEKRILGFDHSEIAFELCKTWNVPQGLRTAVRYHHRPAMSNGNALAFIVHAADVIAMMSGMGAGFDGLQYQVDEEALEFLGLQEEDINDVMTGLVEAVQNISVALTAH